MATATDIYQEILFNDGEGADLDDVNALQRRMRALIHDALITARMVNLQNAGIGEVLDPELGDWTIVSDGDDAANSVAWTPTPHVGFTYPGGGARQLIVTPGTFVQHFASLAGSGVDAHTCLMFVLASSVTLTTAVGDATNPRIDIVEMKLETIEDSPEARDFEDAVTRAKSTTNPDKARRTQMTIQIKAGTPAASPSYPDCTAGFVPVAAVWVPANHNAVHTLANLRDLRWPVGGVRVYDVSVEGFNLAGSGAGAWTSPAGEYRALANAATAGYMFAPCPIGGHSSRLLAVGVMGSYPGNGEAKLYRVALADTTPVQTLLADLQTQIVDELSAGPRFAWAHARHFMVQGPLDIANEGAAGGAVDLTGTPIWTNGQLCGPAFQAQAIDPALTSITKLAMRFLGEAPDTGTTISLVRFVVAHGM